LPVYVLEWVIYVALLWSLFEGLSWLFAALFAAVSKDTSSTPGGKLL
jgi:NhaP-type Na+/H+ or K+/H+ antiporter